jgi:hypothetical protein
MYLLRLLLLSLVLLTLSLSCKPMGPLTPVESFKMLKRAAQAGEAEQVAKLLSRDSIIKIKVTLDHLKSLGDKQAVKLSRFYGIHTSDIRNLTVGDFIKVYLNKKGNILLQILEYNPAAIDFKGKEAVIRVENGMKACFVKEGPYWKLDFTRL